MKNGVKNIQAAAYNGARTVFQPMQAISIAELYFDWLKNLSKVDLYFILLCDSVTEIKREVLSLKLESQSLLALTLTSLGIVCTRNVLY